MITYRLELLSSFTVASNRWCVGSAVKPSQRPARVYSAATAPLAVMSSGLPAPAGAAANRSSPAFHHLSISPRIHLSPHPSLPGGDVVDSFTVAAQRWRVAPL